MPEQGWMRGRAEWRKACVVRAQTIAAGLRMIEFAVEGGLPALGQGARTRVRAVDPGFAAICSYVCVDVGQGRMRVLVAAGEDGGARFMWSLIEGARVRLTVPPAAAGRVSEAPRIAGEAGVRLGFGGLRMHAAAGRQCAAPAANGNAAGQRQGPLRKGRPELGRNRIAPLT